MRSQLHSVWNWEVLVAALHARCSILNLNGGLVRLGLVAIWARHMNGSRDVNQEFVSLVSGAKHHGCIDNVFYGFSVKLSVQASIWRICKN